jgi:hypothetical protein
MLKNGGPRITNKSKTSAEQKWQATIAKDKEKIKKFLENVLQVRGFHAFLFMMKDSCFMQVAHSIAKFATINQIAEDVDGKIFAFIGDRLSDQEPQAILIPTNAWMTWTMHKVGNNVEYDDRVLQGQTKLWQSLPRGRSKDEQTCAEHPGQPT